MEQCPADIFECFLLLSDQLYRHARLQQSCFLHPHIAGMLRRREANGTQCRALKPLSAIRSSVDVPFQTRTRRLTNCSRISPEVVCYLATSSSCPHRRKLLITDNSQDVARLPCLMHASNPRKYSFSLVRATISKRAQEAHAQSHRVGTRMLDPKFLNPKP